MEDNIRMDFKEIGFNTRNLVDLAYDWTLWRVLAKAGLNVRVVNYVISTIGPKKDEGQNWGGGEGFLVFTFHLIYPGRLVLED